jgi:hypothetical protein
MTDVIRGQQKTTGAICILSANHTNARDQGKHAFHQQLASVIHDPFHLSVSSVSRFVRDRKVFFSG